MPSDETGGTAVRARGRVAGAFVVAVWLVMTATDLVWVGRYGLPVPFIDEWWMVPTVTGRETADWRWAWRPHNEHRFVIARPLLLGLYRLAGMDFRAAVYVNVLLLSALAAAMVCAAAAVRGRPAFSDAFFPLTLLHFGQSENLIWSWQLVYLISVAVIGAFLVVIARAGDRLRGPWALAAALCLTALPLCGGMGLAFAPALWLWVVWRSTASWRTGRRRDACVLAGAAAVAAALGLLYFIDYRWPDVVPASRRANPIETWLQFLGVSFGLVDTRYWWLWGGLASAFLLIGVCMAARAAIADPPVRPRALGLLAFLAGVGAMTAAVGWSRSGSGLFGRYATLLAPGLCAVYFAALVCGGRRARVLVPCALALSVGFMTWRNTRLGVEGAARLRDGEDSFAADVRAGLPMFVLADKYSRFPFALYPNADDLAKWMTMLRDAGAPTFRDIRPDPAYRVVRLPHEGTRRADGWHFDVTPPRLVYAIRVRYVYEPSSPTAEFALAWQGPDGKGGLVLAPVRQTPEQGSLLVWVNATVARFDVHPDTKPCICALAGVELLVPESRPALARIPQP